MKLFPTFMIAGYGLLLSGCVVYMPMQCAAPAITDKKQAEITGSSYLNGRVEIAGTYSPVQHLLVRASYSTLGSNSRDSTYYRGHQYDVGVGTYWRVGNKWVLGGLGGFGQATSAASFVRSDFFFPSTRYVYDTHYNKIFGEVYATYQASRTLSFGAAYRVTQVNFTTLTEYNRPVDLSRMTRSEPMLYFRVRPGRGPAESRPVQLQVCWGISSTFGYNDNAPNPSYSTGERDLKQSRGYTTIGVALFPHCLFKPQPEAGAR